MKAHLSALLSAILPALFLALSLTLAGMLPTSVRAADSHDAHAGHNMTGASTAGSALVDGQVKKIDKTSGKVTVSHGPLSNLNMPAMTMVFRVKQADWLNQLQPEEKIRFVADSINGVLTIVRLEAAH